MIGWRRLVIVTVLATSFVIVMDRIGVVSAIDGALS
jgi:hypothetical protein